MNQIKFRLQSHPPLLNKMLCFYLKAREHPFKQRLVNLIIQSLGNKRLDLKTSYGFKMALDLRDLIQRTIFYTGLWEVKLSEFITKNLTNEDIFFDIGCNVGYFSLLTASKALTVISIDPDPNNIRVIEKNKALNGFSNINTYTFGLNDKDEKLIFYRANVANNGISGFTKRNAVDEFTTEVFSLDSLIYEQKLLPKPTILKIDTEGWEEKILLGAKNLLKSDPPRIIIFEAESL
ncbi:FkbM family methyltransferase, partial [bacterium]